MIQEDMGTLGSRIKKLRKSNGLSQEELSNELGVSRQTVLKWENGAMCPNAESLKMLCNYFNVSTDAILSDDNDMPVQEAAAVSDNAEEVKASDSNREKGGQIVCKTNSKRLRYTVLSGLSFVALLVSAIFTIFSGFVAFSSNVGVDQAAVYEVDKAAFYVGMIFCVFFLVIAVVFCRLAVKSTKVN